MTTFPISMKQYLWRYCFCFCVIVHFLYNGVTSADEGYAGDEPYRKILHFRFSILNEEILLNVKRKCIEDIVSIFGENNNVINITSHCQISEIWQQMWLASGWFKSHPALLLSWICPRFPLASAKGMYLHAGGKLSQENTRSIVICRTIISI